MGFGKFIKSVGRAVDPTSKKAPLGQLTRSAIGFVPGGNAAMVAVDSYNATKKAPTNRSTPTVRAEVAAAPPRPPPAPTPPPVPMSTTVAKSKWAELAAKPAVIAGAGAGVLALVVLLVVVGKK